MRWFFFGLYYETHNSNDTRGAISWYTFRDSKGKVYIDSDERRWFVKKSNKITTDIVANTIKNVGVITPCAKYSWPCFPAMLVHLLESFANTGDWESMNNSYKQNNTVAKLF